MTGVWHLLDLLSSPHIGPHPPHGSRWPWWDHTHLAAPCSGAATNPTPPCRLPANDSDTWHRDLPGSTHHRCRPGCCLTARVCVGAPDDPSLGDKKAGTGSGVLCGHGLHRALQEVSSSPTWAVAPSSHHVQRRRSPSCKANGETSVGTVRIILNGRHYDPASLRVWEPLHLRSLLSVIRGSATWLSGGGELGPGTIVGSAAFNMFVVSPCASTSSQPAGRHRSAPEVFFVTASWASSPYVWL